MITNRRNKGGGVVDPSSNYLSLGTKLAAAESEGLVLRLYYGRGIFVGVSKS